MTKQTVTPIVLLIAALLATSGCLRLVDIKDRRITPISEQNAPMSKSPEGKRNIQLRLTVSGTTQTCAFDSIMWRFARMPCVRSQAGFLVMLDTGMDDPGRMSLDVVVGQGYPAHLGEPLDFAYVPSLKLGEIAISQLPVSIVTNRYEVRVLGLPLYRANGLILGMACLRQAKYLAFDNDRREVTIGLEPFTAGQNCTWESFPFMEDTSGGLAQRPYVDLPIAGRPLRLLVDSAGGPRLILNPEQWKVIAPRLKVNRHRSDRFPTWGGFQEVDSYEVAELQLGPLKLKDTIVWVRRGELREGSPLIGLGALGKAVGVWDFSGKRFWIGQTSKP